jgi:hypothetical protein
MVRTFVILIIITLSIPSLSHAVAYDASSLRDRLQDRDAKRLSASERLKASQGNTDSLRLLHNRELFYKLPDGTYVAGMLLDNGKLTPAIKVDNQLLPACVTTSYALIPGFWDVKSQAIRCTLEQHERFALLSNGSVRQINGLLEDTNITQSTINKGPDNSQGNQTKVIPHASKYNKLNKHEQLNNTRNQTQHRAAHSTATNRSTSITNVDSDEYTPPIRTSTSSNSTGGSLKRNAKLFGISVGTWVEARLIRPVSSAESGLIEFELIEQLSGKYRDLPAQTIFFARKGINEAEEKMEALTVNARLPDGEEVKISATIHSLDQTAGLSGNLVRDRQGELLVASTKTALSTLAIVTPIANDIAGQAINNLTGEILNNEKRHTPDNPRAIIRVTPQHCYLKITQSF